MKYADSPQHRDLRLRGGYAFRLCPVLLHVRPPKARQVTKDFVNAGK